jgi:hypothetical protein
MWPLYGSVLHKLGLPVAIYDLANSAFSSI